MGFRQLKKLADPLIVQLAIHKRKTLKVLALSIAMLPFWCCAMVLQRLSFCFAWNSFGRLNVFALNNVEASVEVIGRQIYQFKHTST